MKRAQALALLGNRVVSASTMILLAVAIATFAWSGIAAAESEEAGQELQNYFSNAETTGGQAYVNITAPLEGNSTAAFLAVGGVLSDATGTDPIEAAALSGETCAMIYVFNTEQSLQACCGCPVTPDGLLTLDITTELAGNPVATGKLLTD